MTDTLATVVDYETMIEAFRAAKDLRGLSNAHCDELANLAAGHTDAILGPTGRKNFGPLSFNAFCWAFAVKFVMVIDPDREKEMAEHWIDRQRENSHVRTDTKRLSKLLLERAKPIIARENGRNGGLGRMKWTREQRTKMARRAVVMRWRQKRKLDREAKAINGAAT